jgi:hypothetical protein
MPNEEDVTQTILKFVDDIAESFNQLDKLGPPHETESLKDLHRRLLTTRAAMTRVSELTSRLIRYRGRLVRASIISKGELESAETKVISDEPKKALIEDYSSAKERNAKLAAKTIEERRRVRIVDQWVVDVDSALDYAKNRSWELDRAVRDIDTRLKILAYEPNIQ